jgi:hypothetical protein
MTTKATAPKFSSEGFDLDELAAAVPRDDDDANVIYELNGKVSVQESDDVDKTKQNKEDAVGIEQKQQKQERERIIASAAEENHPLRLAEQYKQQGNEAFLKHEWQHAYDLYSQAIASVPYDSDRDGVIYTGDHLIELQEEWNKEQGRLARQRLNEQDEKERLQRERERERKKRGNATTNSDYAEDNDKEADVKNSKNNNEKPPQFTPPTHPFGEKLSVYHCNRAATLLQLEQLHGKSSSSSSSSLKSPNSSSAYGDIDNDDEKKSNPQLEAAIRDCTIAILLKPDYVKALVRRATAFERFEQTDRALEDSKEAFEIMKLSGDVKTQQFHSIVQTISRLQKLEDERLEKLKTETLDKLKDLGNSILGNFGLSLNNFQAQKDPNTGSYSISFNNGSS